jgi:hypothetical protein
MISLCGSNIIPILITILCCAGLFVYFNLRLSEIKSSVEKQNRVLTSFITNVQQDIRGGAGGMLATPEALAAAKIFDSEKKNKESDKIVVSDDEDDDDDDDDDDSGSDSSSESGTDDDGEADERSTEKMIPISFEVLSGVVSDLASQSSANQSSIMEIIDDSLILFGQRKEHATEEHATEEHATEEQATEEHATEEHAADDQHTYEQLKVDELRKIVSDKNLATKEEVKKLKKPELLVLLKK